MKTGISNNASSISSLSNSISGNSSSISSLNSKISSNSSSISSILNSLSALGSRVSTLESSGSHYWEYLGHNTEITLTKTYSFILRFDNTHSSDYKIESIFVNTVSSGESIYTSDHQYLIGYV